jgi:hypothetical protein
MQVKETFADKVELRFILKLVDRVEKLPGLENKDVKALMFTQLKCIVTLAQVPSQKQKQKPKEKLSGKMGSFQKLLVDHYKLS